MCLREYWDRRIAAPRKTSVTLNLVQQPLNPKELGSLYVLLKASLSLSFLRWCGHPPIGWAVPSTPVAASMSGAAPGVTQCTWSATMPLSKYSTLVGGRGAGGWTLRGMGRIPRKGRHPGHPAFFHSK